MPFMNVVHLLVSTLSVCVFPSPRSRIESNAIMLTCIEKTPLLFFFFPADRMLDNIDY